MLQHPQINPIALQLGDHFAIHWYGVAYLAAFMVGYFLALGRAQKRNPTNYGKIHSKPNLWYRDEVQDLLFFMMLGTILGGRIGYAVFYQFDFYLENPLEFFKIWRGGMSFHGGLIGVLISFALFARKTKRHFFHVSDFAAPFVCPGIFFGRIANFINNELWGKVSDAPWAIIPSPFNGWRDDYARHPTQLYEAFFEGLILFLVLYFYSKTKPPLGAVSGLFLIGYSFSRFFIEFYRLPDAHLGYLFAGLTMGQLLTLPMAIFGFIFLYRSYHLQARAST